MLHLITVFSYDPIFPNQTQVEFSYLFGSYGLGREKTTSDVDIAVLLNERVPRRRYFDLRLSMMGDL